MKALTSQGENKSNDVLEVSCRGPIYSELMVLRDADMERDEPV